MRLIVDKYSLVPGAGVVVYDPMTLTAATMAATAIGSGVSAAGTIAGGNAQQQAGQMAATAALNSSQLTAAAEEQGGEFQEQESGFEATELDQNAATVRAQAQRQALDTTQQSNMLQSKQTAEVAGSGLSTTGSTAIEQREQIAGRGEYMALGEMANGENTARGLEDEATAAEYTGAAAKYGADESAEATLYGGQASASADIFQGNAAATAAMYSAMGTIAGGGASMLKSYGSFAYPTTTSRPTVST
jgi:hypothetical protein